MNTDPKGTRMDTDYGYQGSLTAAGLVDYRETRGTLHYLVGTEARQQEGWFMIGKDRRSISCRKVRGRNRWHIANRDQVLLFRRHDA